MEKENGRNRKRSGRRWLRIAVKTDPRRIPRFGGVGKPQYDSRAGQSWGLPHRAFEHLVESMLQKRIDDQPSISHEMVREAQDILHGHLKRVGLKHTAQRDTIL